MSEEELEELTQGHVPPISAAPQAVAIPPAIDKINNLIQKESNLAKAGVTRYKYMLVIAEALEAMKMGDTINAAGNITYGLIPDMARRQWGAEQAAKLYGDMIERKEIEHDLGDKTLDRFRALSVSELKLKAAEILQGKPMGRLPVIDV